MKCLKGLNGNKTKKSKREEAAGAIIQEKIPSHSETANAKKLPTVEHNKIWWYREPETEEGIRNVIMVLIMHAGQT